MNICKSVLVCGGGHRGQDGMRARFRAAFAAPDISVARDDLNVKCCMSAIKLSLFCMSNKDGRESDAQMLFQKVGLCADQGYKY